MSSQVLTCLAATVVAAVLVINNQASAFCRLTTEGDCNERGEEKGEPLVWRSACLSYAIDGRGSQWMEYDEVEEAIDLAFAAWSSVDCGGDNPPNVIFEPLEASNCQRTEWNCTGNVNTIAFLDPWREPCAEIGYDRNAFAVTTVWNNPSTGEILDVDMMINDEPASRFNAGGPYANCPETGCPPGSRTTPGPADLRSIVTHEVGHFLGIGHSEDENATMFASTDRDSIDKRTLAADDIDAICTIYPPGDLDSTCNASPMGGLELDCEQKECTAGSCPASGSSNGCSAGGRPEEAPWVAVLAALFGLTALRRRSQMRAARS